MKGTKFGNHSDTHAHVNNLNYEKNINEIRECNNKIKALINKETVLYRGPYGEYNDTVLKAAKSENNIMIQWSIDTLDYNDLTGDEMWKRIEEKLESGAIILTHSGTKNTADSLEMIINNIKSKGYEIVPVSELIFKENYVIDSTGKQQRMDKKE